MPANENAGNRTHPLCPPWPENLGSNLASSIEALELCPRGLSLETYSTESFIGYPVERNSKNLGSLRWFDRIEVSGQNTQRLLKSIHLNFATFSQVEKEEFVDLLSRADEILRRVPEVRRSLQSLVRSVHILRSNGVGYDTSFSDPAIPFSIFVSIPSLGERCRVLRVAEAVIHECMHLQLTAWEKREPAVRNDCGEMTWHSPWKGKPRKLQGVLHGMYVFKVVSHVYSKMIQGGDLAGDDVAFALQRIDQINVDLDQTQGVQESIGFTSDGLALVKFILN